MKIEQKLALIDSIRDHVESAKGLLGWNGDELIAQGELDHAVEMLGLLEQSEKDAKSFRDDTLASLDTYVESVEDDNEYDGFHEVDEDGEYDGQSEDDVDEEDELELEGCSICEKNPRLRRY